MVKYFHPNFLWELVLNEGDDDDNEDGDDFTAVSGEIIQDKQKSPKFRS
jgi:hypothetical protein